MLALAALLVLGVFVVRELARALTFPERYTLRAATALRSPGTYARRALAIGVSVLVTFGALVAIGLVLFGIYGAPTGRAQIAVGEVIADGASVGILEVHDRIDAVDGEPLVAGLGPSLTERVNAKHGAPVALAIVRADKRLDVTITPRASTDRNGAPNWLLGIRLARLEITTTDGALGRALRLPLVQAVVAGRNVVQTFVGSDDVELGSVVRITEEFRAAFESDDMKRVLEVALVYGVYLWLFCVVLDLLRLAILVRDRITS